MTVKRFGENGPDQWYELETGERVACGEETIDKLWQDWVCDENVKRNDSDEYVIFEFNEPKQFNP